MKIDSVTIYKIIMNLKRPFRTSFGVQKTREIVLTKLQSGDLCGWGESVTDTGPWYSPETNNSVTYIIKKFIGPWLKKEKEIEHPKDFTSIVSKIRGNPMAKACVEDALWDLYGKIKGKSLSELLGGTKNKIPSGISLGIENDFAVLLQKIEYAIEKKYKRVKIKIEPGWDVEIIKQIRDHFPDLGLMVDANAAYSLKDAEIFKKLDKYDLMMIEQPLHYKDIIEHSKLQKMISTPICLDESIKSFDDAKHALEMDATRIINVKPSRVGGITETLEIHRLAEEFKVPLWVGGMLETGIGRAKNVAVASMKNFTLPNDISESERYFTENIIDPIFKLDNNGELGVPKENGIGVNVIQEKIEKLAISEEKI
ncbi:MAG: o-succinylbenzoate synthase [Candidatus Heimdallarchaeaceae archaeon]